MALLSAGAVAYSAGKIGVANVLSDSAHPENWLRAANLEPGDGQYWNRLGRYRQYDLDAADPVLAEEYFGKAVRENPLSSRYWMDLGNALQANGEFPEARTAYEHAVSNYPISAQVRWAYGNLLLLQADIPAGVAQFHRAIAIYPNLAPLAISQLWQSEADVNVLLNQLLPADPGAYAAALEFFASNRELDNAVQAWNRLITVHQKFPMDSTFGFFDEMIREGRGDEARKMWKEAYDVNGVPYKVPPDGSIVWNGGFEFDLVDGGLDWRRSNIPGVSIEPDVEIVHSGKRSMRIDFGGGSNVDFSHLEQTIPVEPDTTYHFRGWVRTRGITTDSGVRFELQTFGTDSENVSLTPSITGTTEWNPIELEIRTGPSTHGVHLRVRRLQSQAFDNRIDGTAWVDDISLIPALAPQQVSDEAKR